MRLEISHLDMIEFPVGLSLRPMDEEEIEVVQTELVQGFTDGEVFSSMPIN